MPVTTQFQMTSYHQCLASAHLGRYKVFHQVSKLSESKRNFSKEESIFKDWKPESNSKMVDGFLHEIKYWKVPNMIKQEDEVNKVINFLKTELKFLKTIFIFLSARSNFPVIRWLDFCDFCSHLPEVVENQ